MKPIYNYLKSSFCLIAVLLVSCTEEYKEEFYKLKYCSTVVYMVPRA